MFSTTSISAIISTLPSSLLRKITAPPHSSETGDSVLSSTRPKRPCWSVPEAGGWIKALPLSRAQDMRRAKSGSNVIAALWLFHQLFDGLNHETKLPQVVDEFGKDCGAEIVDRFSDPSKKRHRVNINTEYLNRECAEAVSLKPGSKRVSDTRWDPA